MLPNRFTLTLLAGLIANPAFAQEPAWVDVSNRYANEALDIVAHYNPELASAQGMEQADTAVRDLKPRAQQRYRRDTAQLVKRLEAAEQKEPDARVKSDLRILINTANLYAEGSRLNEALMVDYIKVGETTFEGLRVLLDQRNRPERQKQAIERLQHYAGMGKHDTPLTELAKARTAESLAQKNRVGPYRDELAQDLDNTERYIKGIADLFKEAKLTGWEPAHAKLAQQLRDYDAWLKVNVQPRVRNEARLPAAIYAHNLKTLGVDASPEALIERASYGFMEIRDEMQQVAKQIAQARKLPDSDYRAVLRTLMNEALKPEEVLPHYRQRLADVEAIIRRERIITLPQRATVIRLASEAESAQIPAPHMNSPRLIGNTGEQGEFVIPLTNPHAKSNENSDDLNPSASWTLTAHEARPGHELQFAGMVENGVSLARAMFAFNSVNVEGWGLYSEALIAPYMPPEGRLTSLQNRMLRIARAFLDPMVNLGRITPAQAKAFLMKEVVISEPFAQQEADRYAFRDPGQATSYYYGYMKLRGLRQRTEFALGANFDQQAFHDFILSQGLLPPAQLDVAVNQQFIPKYRALVGAGTVPAAK